MNEQEQREQIRRLAEEDGRYHEEAFLFVRRGLDHTVRGILHAGGSPRHVRGQELVRGLRDYAVQEYGPLCLRLLRYWGVHTTDDIGEMVFLMIDAHILGKTEEDTIEDFHDVFDFEVEFRAPFLP